MVQAALLVQADFRYFGDEPDSLVNRVPAERFRQVLLAIRREVERSINAGKATQKLSTWVDSVRENVFKVIGLKSKLRSKILKLHISKGNLSSNYRGKIKKSDWNKKVLIEGVLPAYVGNDSKKGLIKIDNLTTKGSCLSSNCHLSKLKLDW